MTINIYLGGQEWLGECRILRIFNTCTNDLGELVEEMITGGRELIIPNEPLIVTEPLLDVITVEDSQGN